METILSLLTPTQIGLALAITLVAGVVKGMVGFAMPLVMISGLTAFVSPEIALAGLILPTLVGNIMQALRQGHAAAWASIRKFRAFLIAGGITMIICAQMVRIVPEQILWLLIGVPIVVFATIQLVGVRYRLSRQRPVVDAAVGGLAGIMGAFSGVWGPPTVLYLTALDTPKYDQIRIQGVIYGLGSAALLGAHVGSGVLRAETWPFAVMLVVPAMLGIWLGSRVMDRINQQMFRRLTLFVLLLAGVNLIRRAVMWG